MKGTTPGITVEQVIDQKATIITSSFDLGAGASVTVPEGRFIVGIMTTSAGPTDIVIQQGNKAIEGPNADNYNCVTQNVWTFLPYPVYCDGTNVIIKNTSGGALNGNYYMYYEG